MLLLCQCNLNDTESALFASQNEEENASACLLYREWRTLWREPTRFLYHPPCLFRHVLAVLKISKWRSNLVTIIECIYYVFCHSFSPQIHRHLNKQIRCLHKGLNLVCVRVKWNSLFRLHNTLVVVLLKTNCTCAVFKVTTTNYISIETLWSINFLEIIS